MKDTKSYRQFKVAVVRQLYLSYGYVSNLVDPAQHSKSILNKTYNEALQFLNADTIIDIIEWEGAEPQGSVSMFEYYLIVIMRNEYRHMIDQLHADIVESKNTV